MLRNPSAGIIVLSVGFQFQSLLTSPLEKLLADDSATVQFGVLAGLMLQYSCNTELSVITERLPGYVWQ